METKQRGISLIESLVAMLIMAVGLLGVVALQTNALSQQRSAYLETQATNMAQDMMDRIRANRNQANDYNHECVPNPEASGNTLAALDVKEWNDDLNTVFKNVGEVGCEIDVALPMASVEVTFIDIAIHGNEHQVQVQLASEL